MHAIDSSPGAKATAATAQNSRQHLTIFPEQPNHYPEPLPLLFGTGALSATGTSLPLVSLTPAPPTRCSASLLSLLLSAANMPTSSPSSPLSPSSTNSPSAVSQSGAPIHAAGTTQGTFTPTLAARFNQAGAGLPVNLSHSTEVK